MCRDTLTQSRKVVIVGPRSMALKRAIENAGREVVTELQRTAKACSTIDEMRQIATLVVNHLRGTLKSCAIRSRGFGEARNFTGAPGWHQNRGRQSPPSAWRTQSRCGSRCLPAPLVSTAHWQSRLPSLARRDPCCASIQDSEANSTAPSSPARALPMSDRRAFHQEAVDANQAIAPAISRTGAHPA